MPDDEIRDRIEALEAEEQRLRADREERLRPAEATRSRLIASGWGGSV